MNVRQIGELTVVIGGISDTVADHVRTLREEGQSDRTIDYFIGHAIGTLGKVNGSNEG